MYSATEQTGLTTIELSLDDLSRDFIDRWSALAREAIEPNPFLEPHFLLPEAQYVSPGAPLSIRAVQDQQQKLLLLMAARPVVASSHIPFPHLNDNLSPYQFQGGMLLHASAPRDGLITLLESMKASQFRHGMQLNTIGIDSPFSNHLYVSAALTQYQLQIHHTWSRAILDLTNTDRSLHVDSLLSKSRRKSMRRAYAKLQKRGPVSFRIVDEASAIPAAVSRFLDLEQRGWKREAGTAIACLPYHRQFFECYLANLAAERRVMFGELLVGDQVVASTCNLISGKTLFAFKIGWDGDYHEGSPGAWAELELASYVSQACSQIQILNSCSSAGSYLDRLWPHRLVMGNVVLSQSHRAVLFSGVRKSLRFAKHLLWPPAKADCSFQCSGSASFD